MRALRATAHLLQLLLSRPHRQPASLRGGVAVLWEDRGGTAAPPGSARKRKCWISQPRLWNDCRDCEFEGRQTQQQAVWVTSDERQRTRPFAIEDGLGKRCGRVRPWEHGSRCTTTYLTRFICTVVEASHRGGGGLRRDVFSVQGLPSRCKFSRDLSPLPPLARLDDGGRSPEPLAR